VPYKNAKELNEVSFATAEEFEQSQKTACLARTGNIRLQTEIHVSRKLVRVNR